MLQLYLQLLNTCSEQEKFKQLYETYHRLMHWEALRVLQDRQLAEDAVQESFLRMIKNFHKIGEISCPQTKRFVVIIVRNAARNLLAKESRLRSMQDFGMSGSADDETEQPASMCMRHGAEAGRAQGDPADCAKPAGLGGRRIAAVRGLRLQHARTGKCARHHSRGS